MSSKSTLLILLSSLVPAVAASSEISGKWVLHPSLDIYSYLNGYVKQATNNIQKLAEGERYLYALVTSGYYYENYIDSNRVIFGKDDTPLHVARLDKSVPGAKMEPLEPHISLSGNSVSTMEYSQELKCLVVAYSNGAYDILYDDGRILRNTDACGIHRPGGNVGRAISFTPDGDSIVAATDFGAIVLDAESGATLNLLNLGTPLIAANILGGRMIAADTNSIRYFDINNIPASFDAATPLKSDSGNCNPFLLNENNEVVLRYGIFPKDDNSFLFVGGQANSNNGVSVNLLTLPESPDASPCVVKTLAASYVEFKAMAAVPEMCAGFIEEGLVSPTRDGLMLHTQDNVYLIDYKHTGAEPAVTTLKKDPAPYTFIQDGQERFKIMTTFNGSDFRVYVPRVGFRLKKADCTDAGNCEWSNVGDPVEINACSAGWPKFIYYNPRYGMVVHNAGIDHDFSYRNGMADGLCSYRNGVWTQRSLAHTDFKNGFLNGTAQVVTLPAGAAHDPEDPKYIFSYGRTYGMRRLNLDDSDDWTLFTRDNYLTSNPKVANIVDRTIGSVYSTLTAFSQPGFDEDGTMWMTYSRLKCDAYPEDHAELWYWTAEDRAACRTPEDYEAHPMKIINVPGIFPSMFGGTVAARHPRNKNLIFHYTDNATYQSFIYDHNGTPEDTSDDRFVVLRDMIDENGNETHKLVRPHAVFEDPFDGAFLFCERYGMYTITREEAFNYDKPHFSHFSPRFLDGLPVGDFGSGGIAGVTIDNDGRKWIASKHGGLYCISPDRTTVLANFNTLNSDIPSDELLSVAFNPETNSVFVGTRHGVSEFCLTGSGHQFAEFEPSVSPRIVEPHFNGYVSFTGLIDGEEYTLTGPDGFSVTLPAATAGKTQWHPLGNRAGEYSIEGLPSTKFIINTR